MGPVSERRTHGEEFDHGEEDVDDDGDKFLDIDVENFAPFAIEGVYPVWDIED